MTEARNPDFPYDGEEDSLVRAVSTNVNMDLASREPSPALAGLAGNDHGGAPSPAQSSKPGSDTAETASIPAPTVEDATDSSSEAGNHNSDNGSSTHAGPSTHTPAYQEALENLRSVAAAIESGVYLGPAKMRIQAEKNGDRDFTLRVHWDDEETGEAVATPANSRPAVTHAAPADLGRPRDDLGDAPAQPVELPHNNLEPVQETETEANEEEEVNPHALPEIHHQQQRSAASAAPAAGSQTRAIEPGSLLNDADNSGHRSSGSLPSIYTPGGRVFYFPPPDGTQVMAVPYQQPNAARGYVPQYNPPYAAQGYVPQYNPPYAAQGYVPQYQHMSNEPYLVVNPPVVPPAVQATVPGTASWSHPNYRQTSFHSGTAHWRTNPPIIVGQPGSQQPTIINGETHNIIYYR